MKPLLMKTVALGQIPELCRSGHSFLDLCRRLGGYQTRGPLRSANASVLLPFPGSFFVQSWLSRPPPALGLRGRRLCVMLSVGCSWWVCLWFLSSLSVLCCLVRISRYRALGGVCRSFLAAVLHAHLTAPGIMSDALRRQLMACPLLLISAFVRDSAVAVAMSATALVSASCFSVYS